MAQAECRKCYISATLTTAKGIDCQLTADKKMTGVIGKATSVWPEYAGPYVVTPTFSDQTLETNNKLMTSDVEVEAIYVSVVQNPAGGNTVYIGGTIGYA